VLRASHKLYDEAPGEASGPDTTRHGTGTGTGTARRGQGSRSTHYDEDLANRTLQYEDDKLLRSYLARVLPETMLKEIEPSLREMGRLSGGDLLPYAPPTDNEPTLTQWDAWGNRIGNVEVKPCGVS